jgi:hypothetical protein
MGCGPKLPMRRAADHVTLHGENIVDDRTGGSEALSRPCRFEALRLSFALSVTIAAGMKMRSPER